MRHLAISLKRLAFLETCIKVVDILQKTGITRKELERLHDVEGGKQFGIISAYKSNLSRNENKRRNTEMVHALNALGTSWEQVQGIWPVDERYSIENAFFVYDIEFDDLVELADIFDQDAVIFKPVDGEVILYDLQAQTAQRVSEMAIETDTERPRYKEDVEPVTRFRDVELSYGF